MGHTHWTSKGRFTVEAEIEAEAFWKTNDVTLADTNQECVGDSSEVDETGEGLGAAPLIAKVVRGEAPLDWRPYRATEAYPSVWATQADVRPAGFNVEKESGCMCPR